MSTLRNKFHLLSIRVPQKLLIPLSLTVIAFASLAPAVAQEIQGKKSRTILIAPIDGDAEVVARESVFAVVLADMVNASIGQKSSCYSRAFLPEVRVFANEEEIESCTSKISELLMAPGFSPDSFSKAIAGNIKKAQEEEGFSQIASNYSNPIFPFWLNALGQTAINTAIRDDPHYRQLSTPSSLVAAQAENYKSFEDWLMVARRRPVPAEPPTKDFLHTVLQARTEPVSISGSHKTPIWGALITCDRARHGPCFDYNAASICKMDGSLGCFEIRRFGRAHPWTVTGFLSAEIAQAAYDRLKVLNMPGIAVQRFVYRPKE
jgi:hypothetical protein